MKDFPILRKPLSTDVGDASGFPRQMESISEIYMPSIIARVQRHQQK